VPSSGTGKKPTRMMSQRGLHRLDWMDRRGQLNLGGAEVNPNTSSSVHDMQRSQPATEEVIKVNSRMLNGQRRQHGQGMVEYALILVLVSIVVIVVLLTMGNQIQNVFSNVVAALG